MLLFYIKVKTIHESRTASSHHIFETPFAQLLGIILPDLYKFCPGWYDLLISGMETFRFYDNALPSNYFNNRYNFKQFPTFFSVGCVICKV